MFYGELKTQKSDIPTWHIVSYSGFLLKVVSAIFELVCLLSLNETTCQTRKNVFYFTSKAFVVLAKIKF